METYNKIMIYVWLAIAIVTAVFTTVMGLIQGFDRWIQYYLLTIFAVFILIVKKWMMNRMKKHLEEVEKAKK